MQNPVVTLAAVLLTASCTSPSPTPPAAPRVAVASSAKAAPAVPRDNFMAHILFYEVGSCGEKGEYDRRIDAHVVLELAPAKSSLNLVATSKVNADDCPDRETSETTERFVWRGQATGEAGGVRLRFSERQRSTLIDDRDAIEAAVSSDLVLVCSERRVEAHAFDPEDELIGAPETPLEPVDAWACRFEQQLVPGLPNTAWLHDGALLMSARPGLDLRHAPSFESQSLRRWSAEPRYDILSLHAVWDQYFCRAEGNVVPLAHPCPGSTW